MGFVEGDQKIIREVNRKAVLTAVGILLLCVLIYWLAKGWSISARNCENGCRGCFKFRRKSIPLRQNQRQMGKKAYMQANKD